MTTRIRSLSLTTIVLLLFASAPLHASEGGKIGSVDVGDEGHRADEHLSRRRSGSSASDRQPCDMSGWAKIEFGQTRVVTVRRPDGSAWTGRTGRLERLVFDKDIASSIRREGTGPSPSPGSIESAMAYFQDLGMRLPMACLPDLPVGGWAHTISYDLPPCGRAPREPQRRPGGRSDGWRGEQPLLKDASPKATGEPFLAQPTEQFSAEARFRFAFSPGRARNPLAPSASAAELPRRPGVSRDTGREGEGPGATLPLVHAHLIRPGAGGGSGWRERRRFSRAERGRWLCWRRREVGSRGADLQLYGGAAASARERGGGQRWCVRRAGRGRLGIGH
jgi:hypothetical protein